MSQRHFLETGLKPLRWSFLYSAQGILHNPVYGGRLYALRYESREPQSRAKDTYGKSSHTTRALEDAHWLESFPVEGAVVTWEEWQRVQETMKANKVMAYRNAKRFYMLSRLLFCSVCNRRLTGKQNNYGYFYYYCSSIGLGRLGVPKCHCPVLRCEEVEERVWDSVAAFLGNPETFLVEMERRKVSKTESGDAIRTMEEKLSKVDRLETELVSMRLRGDASEVAFERNKQYLKAERSHYQDELERQREMLAALEKSTEAIHALEAMREEIAQNLASATPEERRWMLVNLDTKVVVNLDKSLSISLGVPGHVIPGSETAIVNVMPRA